MADLSDAAKALRDSVAALPRHWQTPWLVGAIEAGALVGPAGLVIFRPAAREIADKARQESVTALLARTASPDVVAALADLLTEICNRDCPDDPAECIEAIRALADQLAALINRSAS